MKRFLGFIILLLFFVGCDQKEKSDGKDINIVKIGFYPTFRSSAEVIVDFSSKKILFYSPTKSIEEPPPPPFENGKIDEKANRAYQKYLSDNPKIIPFQNDLSDKDLVSLKQVVNAFQQSDYINDNRNPTVDGTSINILLGFTDNSIITMNPNDFPNPKQNALLSVISQLLLLKNKEARNETVIRNILRY